MNDDVRNAAEAGVAALASKATSAGALTTIFGVVASSQFVALTGLAIGIVGLLVNWYFRARADKRDTQAHEARMKRLRDTGRDEL